MIFGRRFEPDPPHMRDADDPVASAADALYAKPSEEFMARRAELVASAKTDGDADAARAIAGLRKPTVAAAVVNVLVHHDRDATRRLVDVGDRLRRAHQALDAAALRELSVQRRQLVAELTSAAFALAGRDDPPANLRDEVSATFDAAVADPDIAARLGRLTRSEQFSGFGIVPGPELTLVPGENSGSETRPTPRTDDADPSAPDPQLTDDVEQARMRFGAAEDDCAGSEAAERQSREQVASLTSDLAVLQRELDAAKRTLEAARAASRAARSARREARSTLDRAEQRLSEH